NLAYAYESERDLERAIPLYEQTLKDRVRVLGEDDPDTLTSRNNLAYAYQAARDLDRAIPLYEQTLKDRVRVLGEDHPSTLISRNDLAYAYESVGDPDRAISLYEQIIKDRVRVLGEDHRLTRAVRKLAAAVVNRNASTEDEDEDETEFLDSDPRFRIPIDDLGLPARIEAVLKSRGTRCVGDLLRYSEYDLRWLLDKAKAKAVKTTLLFEMGLFLPI
ncbi:tetratricopeptide repeat protein, partial [Kitasatospora sp. NPDC052896]|uniref:tetratricopeptide repeat protein n=1 Tax=Kitasatospora sp. NPDC052896 TaxID=3364061 RepID=UPI0037C51566